MNHIDFKTQTYYERFVNIGSPTGLTFKRSSSTYTSPLYCTGSYELPFLELEQGNYQVLNLKWTDYFSKNTESMIYPVHPDNIDLLNDYYYQQSVLSPALKLKAIPTASPRTIALDDKAYQNVHLKLDYPRPLGRFSSSLSGSKLYAGPHISSYLTKCTKSSPVYFLPEISAIECQIYKDGTPSGCVIRLNSMQGINDCDSININMVPAFSLYSPDRFNQGKLPFILSYLQIFQNPQDVFLKKFIYPLIESYFNLSINHGLIPEAHSQNILFGFRKEDLENPIVIWRDFQGFFRDESRIDPSLISDKIGTYHLLPRSNPETVRNKRSFLYDWILGFYFMNPLIDLACSYFSFSLKSIRNQIKEFTQSILNDVEEDYFPCNKWFSMSLDLPKGHYLDLISNDNPIYR